MPPALPADPVGQKRSLGWRTSPPADPDTAVPHNILPFSWRYPDIWSWSSWGQRWTLRSLPWQRQRRLVRASWSIEGARQRFRKLWRWGRSKVEQAAHLAERLSVSESLAWIRHRPVRFRDIKKTFVRSWSHFRTWRTCTEQAGGITWEHEDEAGCQSSDHGDDPTDVWGEERQNQRDDKPHQRLQDAPPFLTADTHLHLLALEAQPQSFYHRPGQFKDHISGLKWSKMTVCV